MKKKKLYYLLLILVLTFTPNVVYAEKYIVCNGDSRFPYSIMAVVALLVQLFKIIVPIILILMGSITFAKAVLSSDIDKNLKQAVTVFIRKCISAIAVFFVVVIVSAVINMLPDNEDSKNCIKCAIDPGDCQTVEVDESYKKPEIPQGSGDGTETTVTNQTLYSSSTSTTTGSGVMNVVNTQPIQNNDSNAGTFNDYGNYYLYIPRQVSASKPLIVFLPGMEVTSETTTLINKTKAVQYNAYILIPKFNPCISNCPIWNKSTITSLTNQIKSTYGISKVSLWGYSLGALTAQSLIKDGYQCNSAIIISTNDTAYSSKYSMPIYVVSGNGETWFNSSNSFYNNLQNKNANVQFKNYNGTAHGQLFNRLINDGSFDAVNWAINQ